MDSDDLTQPMTNDDAKDTLPTITAVFRLLREVKLDVENIKLDVENIKLDVKNLNARLDTTNARIDEIELRLARDIEGVNVRVIQGFKEFSLKTDILNRSRFQKEVDYQGLDQRVTELESKAT